MTEAAGRMKFDRGPNLAGGGPDCGRPPFCVSLWRGKATVAYTKPQQKKKEESERLRGERDQTKFIDLRFERWRVVGLNELCSKEERRKREAKRRERSDQVY